MMVMMPSFGAAKRCESRLEFGWNVSSCCIPPVYQIIHIHNDEGSSSFLLEHTGSPFNGIKIELLKKGGEGLEPQERRLFQPGLLQKTDFGTLFESMWLFNKDMLIRKLCIKESSHDVMIGQSLDASKMKTLTLFGLTTDACLFIVNA